MKIEREAQKSQEPNSRVGDNQATRVPTHEGSQLNSPSKANVKTGSTPHLKK